VGRDRGSVEGDWERGEKEKREEEKWRIGCEKNEAL